MKFTGTLPPLNAPAAPITPPKHAPNGYANGHWDFPDKMGGSKYSGFIYVIYDSVLNRGYLGKKMFWGAGNLNSGKESNWRSYVSSSDLIKSLLKARPKDEFEFVCIEQYRMKGALSYAETWSACLCEVPTTASWYNTRIEAVSCNVRERITERHKERLEVFRNKIRGG